MSENQPVNLATLMRRAQAVDRYLDDANESLQRGLSDSASDNVTEGMRHIRLLIGDLVILLDQQVSDDD